MTDDYTVGRWGPEQPPVPPQLAAVWKDVCDRLADSPTLLAGITTTPAGPLKPPDLAEFGRIAEQARVLRPEGDRFVMSTPMYEVVKGFSRPAPHQYGGPLAGMSFGIPIVLDEDLPPNVIEFRDGDRVVKRIAHTTEPAQEMPMPATLRETVDLYPVGLLADLQRDWRGWRYRKAIREAGGKRVLYVRRTVRYLAGRIRARNWRAVKNTFNGYFAEPSDFPDGVTRCGTGWTKKRALRSLRRQYERAGLTMPDVTL